MLEDSSLPQNVVATQVTQEDDSAEHAAQTLELLRRKVMDKDSLLQVVKQIDPYPNLANMTPAQKANQILEDSAVERVDPLTFQPLEQSKAFSIHYLNPDPKLAAVVDQKLVDLFVTFNQRTRAEASRDAYQFLDAQAKQLEQEMAGQEQKLAQFKAKYGDALPEAEGRNLAGEDRTRRDLDALQHDIIQAGATGVAVSASAKQHQPEPRSCCQRLEQGTCENARGSCRSRTEIHAGAS